MTEPQPPPLRADSPVTLWDGRVVPRFRPPDVGGGAFDVDLDQAPQAIRKLEEARRELVGIRQDAMDLARVTPPTNDQVSKDAALALGAAATGGPGSFVNALDSGIAELESMIASLQAGLQRYRGHDERAASDLS
ncbi:hypothetical protein GCM10023200_16400 [Actinomycetospora chlora]|uniref:PE family protein n=1 Tax=Actinomycetospora chlora TaxID=663608 RepID=A0ABP9ANF3_9PSEU